jgi:hypothetical protein
VGVEIVHNRRDLFGVLVLARNVFQKHSPVLLFAGLGDINQPLAHQWFGGDKTLRVPFLAYSLSYRATNPGLEGTGILVSPISCLGDSSMQTTR